MPNKFDPQNPNYVAWNTAKLQIRDADLLLFRGHSTFSRLISIAGHNSHTHAATAAWWGPELFCLETVAFHGGRAETLQSQVEQNPGLIDVYRPNAQNAPDYDPAAVVEYMKQVTGRPYGWYTIYRVSLLSLPGIRWLVPPDTDIAQRDTHMPDCSQARVEADAAGGGFPVMELAPWLVSPGQLAQSPFYEYKFTLRPEVVGSWFTKVANHVAVARQLHIRQLQPT